MSLPDSITTISQDAFSRCSRIKALSLGEGVQTLGSNAFYNCISLESIDIPGSIRDISSAFSGCRGLKSVTIGEGLSRIGDGMFSNCTSLKSIKMNDDLESIGRDAFQNCSSLTELYIPDGVKTITVFASLGPFYGCTGLKKISIGGLATIGNGMFHTGSQVLEELEIRGTVKHIGENAFNSDNPGISYRYNGYDSTSSSARLIVDEGVESIDRAAFTACRIFTEVKLPNSITTISQDAFTRCSRIQTLSLGKGVQNISSGAFYGCNSMHVYLPAGNQTALNYLLSNSIPYTIADSPSFMLTCDANGGIFENDSTQKSAEVGWMQEIDIKDEPQNADKLFSGWFYDEGCAQEAKAGRMPARDMTLYAGWDVNCYTVTLDQQGGTLLGGAPAVFKAVAGTDPAESIVPQRDGYCFTGWYMDGEGAIPFGGVMPQQDLSLYAGWAAESANADYTFADGKAKLIRYTVIEDESSRIYLPKTVNGMPLTSIGADAFFGEPITELYLPSNLQSLDEFAFRGMDALAAIHVSRDNDTFTSLDGVLYTKDTTTLILYPARASGWFHVPDAVQTIGSHAFENTQLQSVRLNRGLLHIGDSAFANTCIGSLALPESLLTIGPKSFKGCKSISCVIAGPSLTQVGNWAFSRCGSMLMLYGPQEDCAIKAYAQDNGLLYNYYRVNLVNGSSNSSQLAQVGSTLTLPTALDVGENMEFTGWYLDLAYTQPWQAENPMPAGELTLYGGRSAVFEYQTQSDAEGTQSIRLTRYLGAKQMVVVPESIGGIPVTQIATGCFNNSIIQLTIFSCVTIIEDGAVPFSVGLTIICSRGSAAEAYALANSISTGQPVYTLSFETNGGATIDDVSAPEGSVIPLPAPRRSGYDFAAWYWNAELDSAVVLDENGALVMPGKNTKIYASWTLVDEGAATLSVTYRQEADHIVITGVIEGTTVAIIPETIHGLPVTSIDNGAFEGTQSIQHIAVPDTVKTLSESAFRGCYELTAVQIGEGVEVIDADCFANCVKLKSLSLPASLKRIESRAFSGSGLTTLALGANVLWVASDALLNCDSLIAIEMSAENEYYASRNGILYDLVDAKLVRYPPARSSSAYVVEAGTYAIGACAFDGASNLKTVALPDTIWELGEGSFAGCSKLTALPDISSIFLNQIPDACFRGCCSFKTVNIPANIQKIGANAFAGCVSIERADIPETVVELGSMAFTTKGMMVYGVMGSAAERFCQANGILFADETTTVLPQAISMNSNALTLKRGEISYLCATLTPSEATINQVTWYSTNEKVATVTDEGKIRGIGGGVATVTAYTANGLSDICEVTVEVDAASIAVSPGTLAMFVGGNAQLNALVLPDSATNKSVEWRSDDESVAQVDEYGVVTAVDAGITNIEAVSHNGLVSVCRVEVYGYVQSIEIIPEDAQVHYAGDTLQLTARLEPEMVQDSGLSWHSSDPDTAAVNDQGLVTYLRSGYVSVYATANDRGVVQSSVALECKARQVILLPKALRTIEEGAFEEGSIEMVVLDSSAEKIGSRAFADCEQLYKIVIPQSVISIADDAFSGSFRITICAPENSYAITYAIDKGIPYKVENK